MSRNFYFTCLVLFSLIPASMGTSMGVSVKNVPPSVGAVTVPEFAVVQAQGTTTIWCNATLTDLNSHADIEQVIGILWDLDTSSETSRNNVDNHYTSRHAFTKSIVGPVSKAVAVRFRLQPDAQGGTWVCKIRAQDKASEEGHNRTKLKVYGKSCSNGVLDSGEVLIDCGRVCPVCLDVSPISLEIPASKTGSGSLSIHSRAGESVQIVAIEVTDLRSDGEVISSENISIELPSEPIEANGIASAEVSVHIPRKTKEMTYLSSITVRTNSKVSALTNLSVSVLPKPPSYIELDVDKNCLDYSITITAKDNETSQPLIEGKITVYHRGKVILEAEPDTVGAIGFQPVSEGTYTITASGWGFITAEKVISVLECKVESCFNNVADNGETGIDCGGPCPPCPCFDGKQNSNETGIDCGGPCPLCPKLPFASKLAIHAPDEVWQNEELSIVVKDASGNPVQAILRVTSPDGTTKQLRADYRGRSTLNLSLLGKWSLSALKGGHAPAEKTVTVKKVKKPSIFAKVVPRLKRIPIKYVYAIVILLVLYKLYPRIKEMFPWYY